MLIPFPDLIRKHNIKPKGVIHVGGNRAQEMQWYADNGVLKSVWVEADPDVFKDMREILSKYKNTTALQACISDVEGQEVDFNVSSNGGESSSMFNFGTHLSYHPDVSFVGKKKLKTTRLDSLLISKGINVREFDFLNIDVQGADGLVLKSLGDTLRLFDYVYIEVNMESLYEDIMLVDEIDEYLKGFGFVEADVRWTVANWGDKFYMKNKESMQKSVFRRIHGSNENFLGVPKKFRPTIAFHYPPDNTQIFEEWFAMNYNLQHDKTEREYLPINWTGYLVNHSFGEDKNAVAELQKFTDSLDRNKKYYTICQFDLGCMVDFKDLDIIVFGMAGGRIDYCLPLICMPHKFEYESHKTLFANFIGRRTHPVRDRVIHGLRDKQGCYISEAKHDLSAYCSIIASSKYTIAPRGFSSTSFRTMEALQYGSIPVIITDELLSPHGINVEEYAVVIKEKDADKVYEILKEKEIGATIMSEDYMKMYFRDLFTYDSNKKLILEHLRK